MAALTPNHGQHGRWFLQAQNSLRAAVENLETHLDDTQSQDDSAGTGDEANSSHLLFSASLQHKRLRIRINSGAGATFQDVDRFDSPSSPSHSSKLNDISSSHSVSSSSSLLSRRQKKSSPLTVDTVMANHKRASVAKEADESFQRLYEKYDIFEVIGQGTVAVVKRARRKSDGMQVAVKLVCTRDQEIEDVCEAEFSSISAFDHPHIIKAYDMFVGSRSVALVLEYFGATSMHEAVKSALKSASFTGLAFREDKTKTLERQLLSAIAEMHKVGLIHRDIKPENILLSNDHTQLKVVDFNTAHRYEEGDALTPTGTLDYLAPEAILSGSSGRESDVWAAGLCMHVMLCGKLAVRRESFTTLFDFRSAVAHRQVKLAAGLRMATSQPCQDFLLSCLALKESNRPTANEACESEYLNSAPQHLKTNQCASMPAVLSVSPPPPGSSLQNSSAAGTRLSL
eukprot:TRINITY_DN91370_c0_g1_i1.p1 TRINITY_DN91370_c0_g1~~TRINITY_DN91370_c0_g1_i1.p1  ORF type:complete len:456 (-),score=50.28 TRINITY_DN91370_c0_g1_i1:185-1552(-)